MGFDGYLSFGGIEIINAQRTTAYVNNLLPGFGLVRRTTDYDTINLALEQEAYRTPLLDGADWVETSPTESDLGPYKGNFFNPTYGFYGLYPLSITGIGDSTMRASVTEGILDGGFIGQERDASRSIRVRGALVGDSTAAVESGLAWLRNALRRNACTMHGDQCGYTDLNYFLAPPEVCVPLYSAGFATNVVNQLDGPLDAATSPLNTPDGSFFPEGQKVLWTWVLPKLDGVQVHWGAEQVDGTILSEHAPVYLRRSNFITNPTFTVDLSGWTSPDTLTRETGDDGVPYAHLEPSSLPTVRLNVLPDPSFENGDPETFGWRGSSNVAQVTDGTAPQGTRVATVAANSDGTWLETNLLGPVEADDGVLSWWAFGGVNEESFTVTILDGEGVEVFSNTIGGPTAGNWARLTLGGLTIKRNYTMRLTTDGLDEMRVDGFLLEVQAGGPAGTYFDGDTAAGGGFIYAFLGGFGGPSQATDGAFTDATMEGAQTLSPSTGSVLSFAIRSTLSLPSVLVELVDSDDVVVASTVIAPSFDYNRFALGVTTGALLRPRFTTSGGPIDIKETLLEGGATLNPYFDGSTTSPGAEFSIYWEGQPNASISRFDFIGDFALEYDSGWRPFLYVDEGYIPSVYHDASFTEEVPLEFQLRPYARTYHRVSCTTAVKIIREYRTDAGAVMEVDFIITAGNPHAFTTTAEVVSDDLPDDTVIYSDYIANLAMNPSPQEDSTGWSANAGVFTVTRTTFIGVGGGYGIRATSTGTFTTSPIVGASYGGVSGTEIPVTAGQVLYPSIYVRLTADHTLAIRVSFRDILGITIQEATDLTSEQLVTVAAGWVRLVGAPVTAPPGAVGMFYRVVNPNAAVDPWVTGQQLSIDQAAAMTSPHAYFDGATTDTSTEDHQWANGDAYDSISIIVPIVEDLNALAIDPDLPALPSPPLPPTIPDIAIDEDQITWRRYYFEISAADVPLWAATIPTLQFLTGVDDIRQLRVRFHPNPFSWDPEQVDPTNYCGEFILSYMPANSILTVTGVSEEAWVSVAGSAPITANHLLYGTGGSPMSWPELSCHIPYLMTIDVPTDLDAADLEYSLSINRRE